MEHARYRGHKVPDQMVSGGPGLVVSRVISAATAVASCKPTCKPQHTQRFQNCFIDDVTLVHDKSDIF